MIYAIIGTSGSGKSTIVRNIMARYPRKIEIRAEGRRQPLYYLLGDNDPALHFDGTTYDGARLAVLGHYETACGGADTIHGMDAIFNLAKALSNPAVLFEGVLLYSAPARFIALAQEGYAVKVLGLSEVPLDVCEEAIRGRRATKEAATGRAAKPFGPNLRKNLEAKHRGTKSCLDRLEKAGVPVVRGDRASVEAALVLGLGLAP